MKTETLIKIAIATGIIAVIAFIMAYLENKNSASSPVGSLRRWMILVIIFIIAAADYVDVATESSYLKDILNH